MTGLKRILTGNFTTTSQDRLGCRILVSGMALLVLVLPLCKLPNLATNGTELAAGLGLAAVMSTLLFVIGWFGHRLSFGTRTDPSLSSEFRLTFGSRKAVCKVICGGLSLLTLLLGVHLAASVPFTLVQLTIVVEGVVSAALAFFVLAIVIGPTGIPVERQLDHG